MISIEQVQEALLEEINVDIRWRSGRRAERLSNAYLNLERVLSDRALHAQDQVVLAERIKYMDQTNAAIQLLEDRSKENPPAGTSAYI